MDCGNILNVLLADGIKAHLLHWGVDHLESLEVGGCLGVNSLATCTKKRGGTITVAEEYKPFSKELSGYP